MGNQYYFDQESGVYIEDWQSVLSWFSPQDLAVYGSTTFDQNYYRQFKFLSSIWSAIYLSSLLHSNYFMNEWMNDRLSIYTQNYVNTQEIKHNQWKRKFNGNVIDVETNIDTWL